MLRQESFSLKATARDILSGDADEKTAKLGGSIGRCGYVLYGLTADLAVRRHADGQSRASIAGTVSCNCIRACPVCASRAASERRAEVECALEWAENTGKSVCMLTLTARHHAGTAIGEFRADLKAATARLRASRAWRRLKPLGLRTITATEVTFGQHGPHVHFHLLCFSDGTEPETLAALERLRPEWLHSLEAVGRSGGRAAFDVRGSRAVAAYVVKTGFAAEIALGNRKAARAEGSRTPFQLLADARDGDARAAALWLEYVKAFEGCRWVVWSKGFKAECGLADAMKAKGEAEAATEPEPELLRVYAKGEQWNRARRRRNAILLAAETGGDLDAAERGETDAERYRAASEVLEGPEGDGQDVSKFVQVKRQPPVSFDEPAPSFDWRGRGNLSAARARIAAQRVAAFEERHDNAHISENSSRSLRLQARDARHGSRNSGGASWVSDGFSSERGV